MRRRWGWSPAQVTSEKLVLYTGQDGCAAMVHTSPSPETAVWLVLIATHFSWLQATARRVGA